MDVRSHLLGVINKLMEENDSDESGEDVSETDTDDTSREPSSAGSHSDAEETCMDDEYDMGGGNCCKKTHFSGERMSNGTHDYTLNGVTMLTDNTIDTHNEYPKLVLVYAPWCGFCIQFKPEYQKLADRLKSDHKTIYAMNGDGSDVMRQCELEGFPSVIYMLDKNRFIKYEQDRNADTLYKWLRLPDNEKGTILKRHGTTSTETTTMNDNGLFSDSNVRELTLVDLTQLDFMTPKIVLFYAEWCPYCHKISVPYKNVAKQLYKKDPNIILYAFNTPLYLESMTQEEQEDFNMKYTIPGYPYLVCLTDSNTPPKEFNGERTEQHILDWIKNQLKTTTPSMVRHYSGRHRRRRYSGEKELLTKNVKEIDDTEEPKDGVVMVYAPWCGHCVTTKPIYLEVAKSLPHVQFYLINGADKIKTHKLIQKYNIKGYPTLFHINKDGIRTDYKKERTIESITTWVNELTQ
jgi:thiol-disulfide isomerase/thioredoxin